MPEVSRELASKIMSVRLVVFDVDGVLTDGRIIFSNSGEETKLFDVKDGHGIKLLMRSGIDVAIITARESEVVRRRAKDLGITHVFQGMKDKKNGPRRACKDIRHNPRRDGLYGRRHNRPARVEEGGVFSGRSRRRAEVSERVDFVSKRPGGRGAARELAELVLKVQGKWDEVMKPYLS